MVRSTAFNAMNFLPLPALCNPRVKPFDTSGKSPAHLHRRNNQARAGKSAAGFLNQTIGCQAIRCRACRTWPPQRTEWADRQGRPRRQTGARRRQWASQARSDASAPLHKPSFEHLPSRTCLQALKANPALSARARSHHGPIRRCPQIPVGDSSCLITLWCR